MRRPLVEDRAAAQRVGQSPRARAGALKRAAMSRSRSICGVGGVARAVGVADVAVGEDRRQRRRWRRAAKWVNVPPAEVSATVPCGSTWSRPSRQPSSRPVVRSWIGGRRDVVEVAEHRDAPGVLVESAGVRALDGPVDAARAALEDLAVLVDERVVGDVAPAERAGVVLVDRPDDARRVLGRVVVAARGVVHDAGANAVVVHGASAAHRFVGAPLGAADDVGRLPGRARPPRAACN